MSVTARGLWSPRRLRTRVALAAAAAALVALVLGGAFVLASATASDRSDLDGSLTARARQAADVGRRTLRSGLPGRPAVRVTRRVGRILGPVTGSGDVALIRIVRGSEILDQLGTTADPGLPTTTPETPSTVDTRDGRWRIVQRRLGRGLVVQVASPLAALDARHDALLVRLVLAAAGGVLGTVVLAFLLAGPALGALTRLRRDAGRVATTADLGVRMPASVGPAEVRDLAGTLNAMLERLQGADQERRAALDATQRFAADAGHELRTPLTALTTTVHALRTHPELPEDERMAMLDEISEEHARLVELLDALQALARGDVGPRTERGPVDLADLADQAVAAVRAVAPRTTIRLNAPAALVIDGWAPGLRLLLDNLLSNAVRHGRPDGNVVVTLSAGTILVDDDGPGIPVADRDAVVGRFARGRATTVAGSGLGLALVDQQARLHGGRLTLEDAPDGGLRARVTLG